jgi:hypothetical protein
MNQPIMLSAPADTSLEPMWHGVHPADERGPAGDRDALAVPLDPVGHRVEIAHVLGSLDSEARLLDATLRWHHQLRRLFLRSFEPGDPAPLTHAYLRLLKLNADFLQYLAPALRASSHALRHGDAADRRWSDRLMRLGAGSAAAERTAWLRDDMRALGASAELVDGPPHTHAIVYGRFCVGDAARHPYAILGAKGVVDRLLARIAGDLARGVLAAGIANADRATRFLRAHAADPTTARDGDRELEDLVHPHQRCQALEGAYITSGSYRTLVHHLLAP